MSGYLPQGTTLQLSNTAGDISHQGVLASNLSGTTNLTASSSNFPSSSTGTSVGHYHYTDASTKSLKFLNASGSGAGGHEFFVSSSTQAPVKTFSVDTLGLSLDTKIKNSSSNTELDLAFNELRIKNDLSRVLLVHEALKFIYNDAVNVQVNNSPENPNIYFSSATNNSQLTATDLKFDGVSLKTQVETNEDNIAKNKILSTNTFNIYNSSAIYADGKPPLAIPSTIQNTYAYPGWYYKNTVSGKINWYLPPKTATFKVSDLLGFYLNLFNLSTTSNDNTLFLTVYTKVDSLTPNHTSWYKSSNTYVITDTPTINTSYTFFENASGSCPSPNIYASTLLEMSPSTVNNPRGTYAQTEDILFFSIGTNSASPINSVEFVLRNFGVMTVDGTSEFTFQNLL